MIFAFWRFGLCYLKIMEGKPNQKLVYIFCLRPKLVKTLTQPYFSIFTLIHFVSISTKLLHIVIMMSGI